MRTTVAPTMLVFVSTFPHRSQTSITDHLRGIQQHGWRTHVACLSLNTELLREHAALTHALHSVHVLRHDADRPRNPLTRARLAVSSGIAIADFRRSPVLRRGAYLAPRLAEIVDTVRPDVVHAHWAPNTVAAALATTRSKIPVIGELHGYDLTRVPRQEGWHGYRVGLRDCTLVVHSEFGRALVQENLGTDPVVTTYGIDPNFTAAERPDRWQHPLQLLSVGRLVPEKGHDTAIRALAHVRDRRPELDARLTIIGGGPQRDSLERLAADLGMLEAISFESERDRAGVAAQMRASEILIVASRPADDGWIEMFGRVAAEGVCSGMAVITTDQGGLPEAVGDAGTIVDGEASSMAKAIEALVDHDRPSDVAARTRRRAAEFDLDQNWAMDDRLARKTAGLTEHGSPSSPAVST